MRAIVAGLFVFAVIMLTIPLWGLLWRHVNPLLATLAVFTFFIGLTFAAFSVIRRLSRKTPTANSEQFRLQLDEQGLLEAKDFRATRAFMVDEYEDEGPHYFLDLVEGGVLYLNGQYLYKYEPVDDEGEPEARRFPCTAFTVRRHKTKEYVLDIDCRGEVLHPEIVVPSDEAQWYDWKDMPGDGDVIADRTFDELKGMILGEKPKPR